MSKPNDTSKTDPLLVMAMALGDSMSGKPTGAFIEDMEASGQRQLVASTSLPTKVNGGYRLSEAKRKEMENELFHDKIMGAFLVRYAMDPSPDKPGPVDYINAALADPQNLDPEVQKMVEQAHEEVRDSIAEFECLMTEEAFRRTGIKFGPADSEDPMFMSAELPEGWKKVGSDHSMWSKVVDEKGRERLSIFYKAAFYDRDAHIDLCSRFSVSYECDDYEKPRPDRLYFGVVKDAGTEIYRSEGIPENELADDADAETRYKHKWGNELARDTARAWADENLPEGWDDLVKCWDVEVSL